MQVLAQNPCEGFAGASICAICGQTPFDRRNDVESRAELRDGHLQLNCVNAVLCIPCLVAQIDTKDRDSLAINMLQAASAPAAGLSSPPKLT